MQSIAQSGFVDGIIGQFDRALRALTGAVQTQTQPNPALLVPESDLSDLDKRHAAGLMRVNHTGEVCAQALYQGQALTAKLSHTRAAMDKAAAEELDHLSWCAERLRELQSRPSLFNPLWYGLSLGMGAAAGLISDKVSLGFVAATEDRVCAHLNEHLEQLPGKDEKSKVIVKKMLSDEARHAQQALEAGGYNFPAPVKAAMGLMAKVMTQTSYRL